MKRFRINDVPVLNFVDLQDKFSPRAILDERGEFPAFASVHCLPIRQMLTDPRGGRYAASHLTKRFWLDVLGRHDWAEGEPVAAQLARMLQKRLEAEVLAANSESHEALSVLLDRALRKARSSAEDEEAGMAGDRDETEEIQILELGDGGGNGLVARRRLGSDYYETITRTMADGLDILLRNEEGVETRLEMRVEDLPASRLRREMEDARVEEKLAHLSEAGLGAEDSVALLAICELSEVDALQFQRQDLVREHGGGAGDAGAGQPAPFMYEDAARLEASSQVCRFLWHTGALDPGATIRTVRVEALQGGNLYGSVRIELVDPEEGVVAEAVTLLRGEHRYCLASGDRVLRFLPDVVLEDSLCVARPDLTKPDLRVIPAKGESWSLQPRRASCLAVAPGEDGFAFIEDGRVNTSFYEPARREPRIRIPMENLGQEAVHLALLPGGYRILLADCTVVTNLPARSGKDAFTARQARADASGTDREVALSTSGRSAAFLLRKERRVEVLFNGRGSRFTLDSMGSVHAPGIPQG